MKLKDLLAIVSRSAIGGSLAVGISFSLAIPSAAETVRESQIKLEPTKIGNKDYRNKQSTPSIVGSWFSSVNDNEHRHTDPVEIYIDLKADGTQNSAFRREDSDGFSNISYKYAPTKSENLGALVQEDNEGRTFLSVVQWISSNEFIITLVKDSHEPHRNGLKRRYVRIDEPVATILQERAQQEAANTQRQNNFNNAVNDYNRTVQFGNNLPSALRGLSNWSP